MKLPYVLTHDVRTFKASNVNFLHRTEKHIPSGSTIEIGEPRKMFYDHRWQVAVPTTSYGEEVFIILSETNIAILE